MQTAFLRNLAGDHTGQFYNRLWQDFHFLDTFNDGAGLSCRRSNRIQLHPRAADSRSDVVDRGLRRGNGGRGRAPTGLTCEIHSH